MIAGYRVTMTAQGKAVKGVVEFGSDDRRELFVTFAGEFVGYRFAVPLRWDLEHNCYRELIGSVAVIVEFEPVTAEHIAVELRRILKENPQVEKLELVLDAAGLESINSGEKEIRDLLTAEENARLDLKISLTKEVVQ